ncbi:protein N-lysine methyltransferase family protein [Aestuariirhabdus sp. Z084]|uniref:class I SAM-dependent methyltransferase n=1 Tax=Aestuariirhabdus haliotis TaxID=2918751 RepID=UPI00201B437C|nr:protein N-lysine methyltransferase family protein [Aestuariirhabdus haliotis]MCL6415114.1 protein N-lysine methyltransferase family protein [Aestuariirhabdus haliotis]MCL6419046.1 protein N-lysine methyltransferase family protein [Aestuariirhabdus haliotis]
MTNPRLSYQTIEFGKIDIHLCTLRNIQEFHDPNDTAKNLGISSATWPIFGVVWPSSLVLAHYMLDYDIGAKRTLEIGCGTAISSLLLNKQNIDITATDYHPEVEKFLVRNTHLNGDNIIPFERTNWGDNDDKLGRFDLIIGSDLLYEDEHITLLSEFINAHSNPQCEVIIVDPGRGRKNKLAKNLSEQGYKATFSKPINTDYLENEFKGRILRFARKG